MENLLRTDPDHLYAGPTNWLDLQSHNDDFYPAQTRAYFKSLYFDKFSDDVVTTVGDYAAACHSPLTVTEIHRLGGAFSRFNEDATAFGNREARYLLNIRGVWTDPTRDSRQVGWVRDFWSAIDRYARGGH